MLRLKDWYDHPEYYEAIFGTDTEKEMDFLWAVNVGMGTGGARFFEPACGAGRLIEEGAARGLEMIGCDLSEKMLAHAKKRLSSKLRRRVSLHHGRMEDFAPRELRGTVDLAFNLVSTFRYLDSEEAAVAHLRSVRSLLAPGGLFVLGFHVTDYRRRTIEHERWLGRHGQDRVVCNTREWPPERRHRRSRMRNRLRVTGPEKDWLIETEWYFRTYDEREADALFAAGGLEPIVLYDFDYDQPLDPASDRLDRVFILRPR